MHVVFIGIDLMDSNLRMMTRDLSDFEFEVLSHTALDHLPTVFGRYYEMVPHIEYGM